MIYNYFKINFKKNQGFTLIELLIAIIIIGILSGIALPSYLSQASKARSSEAKSAIGTINRYQQVHRVEYNRFATSLSALDVRIASKFYTYQISSITDASAITSSIPQQPDLTSVSGGLVQINDAFLQIICESTVTSVTGVPSTVPTETDVQNSTCPPGYNLRQ